MKSRIVTPRRLHCPVELDVLLAEIQGELPIDERRDVQAHLATCVTCRARRDQLRATYQQIAALADVPVVPVAGVHEAVLRDSVGRLRTARLARGLNLSGRSLFLLAIGLIAAIALLIVVIVRPVLQTRILATTRSQNSLTKLAAIGPGTVYAETIKLIPVKVGGTEWDLGEVVALNESTGQVARSLPASSQPPFLPRLGIGSGTDIRPALSSDGRTLVEVAIAADGRSPSAFAAIDTASGAVRYVAPVALPTGVAPQSQPIIRQLWISPDNTTVYVLTDLTLNGARAPHILAFALTTGQQSSLLVPPPDAAGPALGGNVEVLSPDGQWLYDAQVAVDVNGQPGALVSFVQLAQQRVAATLFVPGNAAIMALAVSPDGQTLALFSADEARLTFISTATQAVTGTLALEPSTSGAFTPADAANVSVSVLYNHDGRQIYAARNINLPGRSSYDLWGINPAQHSFTSLTQVAHAIQRVVYSSDGSTLILLRADGTLQTLAAQNPQLPAPWVTLAGGTAIIQVVG